MKTDQLIALGVFILLLPVFGALIFLIVQERRRVERAWRAFARKCEGLGVERDDKGWPRLVGTYRNVPVHVFVASYGARSHDGYTQVTASCRRQLPNDFALSPQGVVFAVQQAFGAQDIRIGDESFDRTFVIRGADESQVRALLADARLRQQLLAYAASEPGLAIFRGHAELRNHGTVTKHERLHSMLEAATLAALALESGGDR